MSAKTKCCTFAVASLFAHIFSSVAANESLGNLAQYPPERSELSITTADNGAPQLQPEELLFNSGQYYRLTSIALTCGTTSRAGV